MVVDDDERWTEVLSLLVSDRHTVRTAVGGREALEAVGDDVDVVLLDRRMPDCSGDDVLERIRERGLSCRVIMVTAVDSGPDVAELDCDGYLVKPVTAAELNETIDDVLDRADDDRLSRRYYALHAKVEALREREGRAAVESSDDHAALLDELAALEDEMTALRDRVLEEQGPDALLRDPPDDGDR